MAEAKTRFPQDLDYVVALDTTLSVTAGIKEIKHTLVEALVLVILVVYLSAGMESDAHPATRRAGFADRHVYDLSSARLLHQHALAIWPGARDRAGGG